MEPNFQTSFIPKKPMIEERATPTRPIGIFTVIALFVLFTVAIVVGGLYFYKGLLNRNLAQMSADLKLAQGRFEPARIAELQLLDKRLRAANEILDKHIAVTPIFQILQDVTMKTVRYTKFTYAFTPEGKISVKMGGMAVGYRSVALQSDLYTSKKQLIDPIFSNLTLDDHGNVLFDLDFSVDPSFVDYKQLLLTASDNSSN